MFTKENAASYIPLLQAMADGKTIQMKSQVFPGKWVDVRIGVDFDREVECYRIKPEPRVIWYNPSSGNVVETDLSARSDFDFFKCKGWAKYAEVIE